MSQKETARSTLLAIAIVVMMAMSPIVSSAGHGRMSSVESQPITPVVMELKNLTRDEGVAVSAQDIPGLVGTPVDSNDVKNPDNDILVYVWSNTSKDWHQIPFQVDERNASTGSYGVNNANGVLDGIDEIVFMSGDAGDRAPGNAWVVGCDAPRYEIKVFDPLTEEDAWAYIYKSSTVEANFIGDYSSFDKDHNDITAQSYEMGFHDGVGMIVDELRILPSAGGDGTDLIDLLQMEISASALGITKSYDEDDMGSDFKLKKDGYVRSLGVVSIEKHYHSNGVDVDAYFNFTWCFYPDYVNASGYLDMTVSGANLDDLWMALDHSPNACPMDYRDSLGNTAIVDGNNSNDNISSGDLERWWEMKGSHGGYVCLWNLQDFKASDKYLKFDDNSSVDESSGTNHVWSDHKGHYGLTGSDFQTVDKVQKSWANISIYPLASNVSGKAENELQNETHPLQVIATEQHSPAVWVNKSADKQAVDSQDTIQYTIYFNNTGDRTAPQVWINDTLPAELTYVNDSANQSGGTRTGDYNWTFHEVAPGNHSFVINCTVDAEPGRYITNYVHCDFLNDSGAKMPESSDTYSVHVRSPTIEVEKTADKGSVSTGENITYTIYFNNTGETSAEKVWINETLPDSVEYLSDNSSDEGGTKTGDYTWEFSNVGVGNHWFTITAKAKDVPNGTSVDNYVHLDYSAAGGYKMNESYAWANSTIYRPVISLDVHCNRSHALAADSIGYIIYFNNTGSTPAPNLWMNVTLPDAVSYVSDSNSTEGGSKTGNYNWTFSNVSVGDHSFQINATVKGGYADMTDLSALVSMEYKSEGGVKYSSENSADSSLYAPDISVKKTADISSINPDDTPGVPIQYTIHFDNNGHASARTVWINETLPSNVQYLNDTNSTEGGTKTGDYTWIFHDVAPGEHYFVINVSVNQTLVEGDWVNNTVYLDYLDASNTSMPSSSDSLDIKATRSVSIQDLTTGNPTTGDSFSISANVTGEKGVASVHVYYWFDTVSGSTAPENATMSGTGDIYSCDILVPSDALRLHYNISGSDTTGNWSETGVKDLTVYDDDPPSLSDTTSGKISAGADYNISADASDNIGIAGLYLNYTITYSDGTNETGNVSMNGSAPSYWYELSIGDNATWLNYTIWANDTNTTANWNSSSNEIYVDSEPPEISDRTSGTPTTGDPFKVSANVTDDSGNVAEADVEYWFGTGTHSNETMTNTGGNTGEYIVTIPSDSTDSLHYIFHARDSNYNWNETSERTLNVEDNDAPAITDNSPSTATTGDSYTFSADVTDNIGVGEVDVEYWFGTGTHSNETMTNTGGNTWEHTVTIPSDSTDSLHYIFHASDTSHNWNSTSQELVSVSDNDPPVADAGEDISIESGETATLDASASTDNIGIVSYTWSFDDGSEVKLTGETAEYTFVHPGDYEITLLVTDAAENTDTDTAIVHVADRPPELSDTTTGTPTTGDYFTINASASDDTDGLKVDLEYWFDGAEHQSGHMEAKDNDWQYIVSVPSDARIMHYIISAEDKAGNKVSTDEVDLNVLDNDAPFAGLSISFGGNLSVGTEITIDGSTSSDNIEVVNYTWSITGPEKMTFYGSNVNFSFWTPGKYNISLTVSDAADNTGRAYRDISVSQQSQQPEIPASDNGTFSWWWLIIVILLIIGLVILFAKRKKGPEEDEESDSGELAEEENEPSSSPEEEEEELSEETGET